jgi:hypothetical protein
VIGLVLAVWLEFRDQCVRTEEDVVALLQLPVLSQVPWVTGETPDQNGNRKAGKRDKKEMVEV